MAPRLIFVQLDYMQWMSKEDSNSYILKLKSQNHKLIRIFLKYLTMNIKCFG